jgi:alkyl hydroperoxide reductase subunit F
VLQAKLQSMGNVTVLTNAQTTEISGADDRVDGLVWKDRATGVETRLPLAGVFVQIGLVPNTEWLAGSGLELSGHGEIVTDGDGRTNLPGVFAAGDATTVPYKQIVVAMGEGSKAALSAFDYLIRNEPLAEAA